MIKPIKKFRCTVDHKRYIFTDLAEAARFFKLSYNTVYSRIHKEGWSVDKALSTPIAARKPFKYKPSAATIAYNFKLALECIPQWETTAPRLMISLKPKDWRRI